MHPTIPHLIPGQVSLAQLESLYRSGAPARLHRQCRDRVEQAASLVARLAAAERAVYGINTGFGKLAHTRIAPQDIVALQRNLILSHCCGVGAPLSKQTVRLIIVLKLLSLGHGASGVRWQIITQLEALLERDVTPIIPAQGSVGASGDLAPLAHLAAVLIGEGQAEYAGEVVTGAVALQRAGLSPVVLGPKEGLALINGTQVSTALTLAGLFAAWHLTKAVLFTGAASSDALMASTEPFRPEIHALRGLQGQIDAAACLQQLLLGSAIREAHRLDDERVQDPYCLRCQPQVMGACIDLLRQVACTLETEANAVTDNPLVLVEQQQVISGGNFHAEPVAFAADQCALAIAEIGSIAQRRVATLVDPALSYGLPGFLSPEPGLNSGFMSAEIATAALMAENKHAAAPCSIDSIPTSANQEDHVSMSCHAAYRLIKMNDNLAQIIAIEWIIAAQGLHFRAPLKSSKLIDEFVLLLRSEVAVLGQDRYMADDLAQAKSLLLGPETTELLTRSLFPTLMR